MTQDASATTPPDRGHLETEQPHHASADLHTLTTAETIELMTTDMLDVHRALEHAKASLGSFIDALVPRMRAGGRLIYAGAGTSGRLGVLDASECPPTFHVDHDRVIGIIAGGDSALRRSSEHREDDPDGIHGEFDRIALNANDTVLGIAAGGTTPYVRGALVLAEDRGARTGFLTCTQSCIPPTPTCQMICIATGPEVLTGSTRLKAGTATKAALNIITTTAFIQLGKVHGNRMVDVRATNDKLRDRAIRILMSYCPTLDRMAAAQALGDADNHLKTAIVMQQRDVDLDAAQRLLDEVDGQLDRVL
ncbi:MAG: N-acetylmuramic acid 6-phosphate etherase [Planctomycetota bacterium]